MSTSNPTEAETRKQFIDKALERAGWNVDNAHQVGQEIPVDGFDPRAAQAQTEFYISEIAGNRAFSRSHS